MKAKKINIEEWEYLGEGGTAVSYSNKTDGRIFMKLNRKGYPEEAAYDEYNASIVFNRLGLRTPEVYDFVTDGERFGYTGDRLAGKMSYARTISLYPERTDELCRRFAEISKALHSTKADVTEMKSLGQYLKEMLGDLSYVPADVAQKVKCYLGELSDAGTCLHGDLNPGNVISDGREDYWIGVNAPVYGDPYWDIADMHVLCYCIPPKTVKELYHNDVSDLRAFFTVFKRYYFGESWDSPEVGERIAHAAMVRCCALIRKNPETAYFYVPLIRGKKLLYRVRLWISEIRNRKR